MYRMLVTIDTSLIPSPTFSPIIRKNNTNKPRSTLPGGRSSVAHEFIDHWLQHAAHRHLGAGRSTLL
jgi:hypothetical protein